MMHGMRGRLEEQEQEHEQTVAEKKELEQDLQEQERKAKKWRCHWCWTRLQDEEAVCQYCKDRTVPEQDCVF